MGEAQRRKGIKATFGENDKLPTVAFVKFDTGNLSDFQRKSIKSMSKKKEIKSQNLIALTVSLNDNAFCLAGHLYFQEHQQTRKMYCELFFDAKQPPPFATEICQKIVDGLPPVICKKFIETYGISILEEGLLTLIAPQKQNIKNHETNH